MGVGGRCCTAATHVVQGRSSIRRNSQHSWDDGLHADQQHALLVSWRLLLFPDHPPANPDAPYRHDGSFTVRLLPREFICMNAATEYGSMRSRPHTPQPHPILQQDKLMTALASTEKRILDLQRLVNHHEADKEIQDEIQETLLEAFEVSRWCT